MIHNYFTILGEMIIGRNFKITKFVTIMLTFIIIISLLLYKDNISFFSKENGFKYSNILVITKSL